MRVEGGMAIAWAWAWAWMRRAQLKRVEGFDGDALSRDGDAASACLTTTLVSVHFYCADTVKRYSD